RDYIQKRIKKTQNFKLTSVILNIHLLMKKIHSYLNSLKDKKNSQTLTSAVNSAQTDTVTANNNIIKEFKEKKEKKNKNKKNKNNSESKTQLAITDDSESFQMTNLTEMINMPVYFVKLHK
ncbi:hypothetical protein EMPG_11004, partial [Blastomyces silverae]